MARNTEEVIQQLKEKMFDEQVVDSAKKSKDEIEEAARKNTIPSSGPVTLTAARQNLNAASVPIIKVKDESSRTWLPLFKARPNREEETRTKENKISAPGKKF